LDSYFNPEKRTKDKIFMLAKIKLYKSFYLTCIIC
jgi:hypothetical protein